MTVPFAESHSRITGDGPCLVVVVTLDDPEVMFGPPPHAQRPRNTRTAKRSLFFRRSVVVTTKVIRLMIQSAGLETVGESNLDEIDSR
jgi:hypothetical protein